MDDFLKKVEEVLNELIFPGDKVLVGVSGGADSIALLHVLNRFSLEKNYTLVVAHINHMARGVNSFEDAQFVKDVAIKLNLPFFSQEINVDEERLQFKKTFQEAARSIRYKFFEEILARRGCLSSTDYST